MKLPMLLLAGSFSLALIFATGVRAQEIVVRGQRTVDEVRAMNPQSAASEQSEKANLKGATRVTVTATQPCGRSRIRPCYDRRRDAESERFGSAS